MYLQGDMYGFVYVDDISDFLQVLGSLLYTVAWENNKYQLTSTCLDMAGPKLKKKKKIYPCTRGSDSWIQCVWSGFTWSSGLKYQSTQTLLINPPPPPPSVAETCSSTEKASAALLWGLLWLVPVSWSEGGVHPASGFHLMRSWELDEVCPGFWADRLRSGDVVFACHGPITPRSQVEKPRQKQQGNNWSTSEGHRELMGRVLTAPQSLPALHRGGPLIQFAAASTPISCLAPRGRSSWENAVFLQGTGCLVGECDR